MMTNQFLWGAGISAFQAEGIGEDKGDTSWDLRKYGEYADFSVASDFYHKYKEDIALLARLGIKVFRFSIAWSRILPTGRVKDVNYKGIEFYHRVIDECLKYDIEPLVTIFHFDMPHALIEKGGWLNRQSVDWYFDYASLLFEEYGEKVRYWQTINEQNVMVYLAENYHTLPISEGCKNPLKEIYQQNHHMFVAQAKVINLCHETCSNAKIGPAPNISYVYPLSSCPEDNLASQNYNAIRNWLYLDIPVKGKYTQIVKCWLESQNAFPDMLPEDEEILANGKPDFLAINYYNTLTCSMDDGRTTLTTATDQQTARGEKGMFKGEKNPYLQTSEFGWEIDPVGLRVTLREIESRYGLPVIITENGLGAKEEYQDKMVEDDYRIDYVQKHIAEIEKANQLDGCQVFGYCIWSAIDIVSTHQGFSKRYGLIYVDRGEKDLKELKRYPKKSYYWYKDYISNHPYV